MQDKGVPDITHREVGIKWQGSHEDRLMLCPLLVLLLYDALTSTKTISVRA